MKKLLVVVLALSCTLIASSARAQTVATFDNPLCSGNGIGVYDGIDFSLSPWDCEKNSLTGETGTSISWYQQITTGHFKFQAPQVLVSLSAATSSGSGTVTITTDAGETFTHAINTAFQTVHTGFSKPASVVTVQYPGGWTIQLDNIAYQSHVSTAASGKLNVTGALTWDDGTPVAGSVSLEQILSPTSQKSLGAFPVNSAGAVNGTITIDLSQPDPLTFQIVLLGPTNTTMGTSKFSVLKAMFPATATGLNAKIALRKANFTIKTFDIGLTP